ncbi:YfhO family protein [Candidatus Microgenomates bacterium]|nr:YfhO family protein [Candidatus Microgenomates bacterium]
MIEKLAILLFLLIPVVIFFFRLFYPKTSLFMIPDFGESDVLHLNYPLKELLTASLKKGEWPLWTPNLASGFPILAEGQIGTFYLPNLLLFRFLPTITAYNLNLAFVYFLSAFGTYLVLRFFQIGRIPSIYGALVFAFSGFLTAHLGHFNLIQAVSLTPWLFWSFLLLNRTPNVKYSILAGFFLSQQIFTGHFYIVFISLVGVVFYLIVNNWSNSTNLTNWIKSGGYFLAACFIGFLLSAIQLLPTFELWQTSSRAKGLDFDTITSYPYPFKHLMTFIKPYFFGDPAKGTYPPYSSEWGIFWENTAYLGILPLILAVLSLFLIKIRPVKIFLLLTVFSLLLVTGKYSPLYFIFSFPPFSYFRVPSKFLLLTDFSLSVLAAFSLDKIIKWLNKTGRWAKAKKYVLTISIFGVFFWFFADEFRFSYNYPPVSPAEQWLAIPQSAIALKQKNNPMRVTDFGTPIVWNKVFLKTGLQNLEPFVYFRNGLYPNYNSLFDLSQTGLNTGGLIPRRSTTWITMAKSISYDEKKMTATVSALSKNVLSLSSADFLVTPFGINDPQFKLTETIPSTGNSDWGEFKIFQNMEALPRAYLAKQPVIATTVEELQKLISDRDFVKNRKVIIEKEIQTSTSGKSEEVTIISGRDSEIEARVKSDGNNILVLTDSYYPGWIATVDGKKAEIFPVNLNQKGLLLSSGEHQIKYTYQPTSFVWGKKITILSGFIIFLVVFLYRGFSPRKVFGNRKLSPCP